jgi:PIN domain nuclease of toxin-antitoxin system
MISYKIEAKIVNIMLDAPKATDMFLVDTNVWYWMTYSRASQSDRPPTQKQTTEYPNYTKAALSAKAKIFLSCLSFAELARLIEKAELDIYEATSGEIYPKEYRHNNPSERAKVIAEVKSVWGQVSSLAELITVCIDPSMITSILSRIHKELADVYDLFICESMTKNGVLQVITDDGDYATISDIQVFTANQNVINAARAQGKLLKR